MNGSGQGKQIFKKIFEEIQNKSGKEKITIVILIGVLLLVVSLPVKSNSQGTGTESASSSLSAANSESSEDTQNTAKEYQDSLEKKLEEVLAKADGVGKVKVVITLKRTSEKIIACDDTNSQSDSNETDGDGNVRSSSDTSSSSTSIYSNAGSGSTPYVKMENMPEVEGIIVVAEGGGDGTVASNITSAVEALLNIPAHKIKVLKMS